MAKLCIIASRVEEEVKKTLIEEAQKLFESVVYAPIHRLRIEIKNGKSTVFFKDQDLSKLDMVWIRSFFEDYRLTEILLDIMEEEPLFLVNSLEGFQACNHKYLSIQNAIQIGVPVPNTYMCVSPKVAMRLSDKVGFPTVIKLLSGFGGKGVMLINSKNEFLSTLETLQLFKEFISGQEFLPTEATDYRVLVIGKEMLCIQRKGGAGEWRSNVSTGGKATRIKLPLVLAEMARAIAHLLGLHICSVDFVKAGKQFVLIETNFTPGVMEPVFKNEIAQKMLGFLKEEADNRDLQKKEAQAKNNNR